MSDVGILTESKGSRPAHYHKQQQALSEKLRKAQNAGDVYKANLYAFQLSSFLKKSGGRSYF